MNKQKDMSLTFEQLIASIRQVHDQLAAQAGRAVNISLTLRNWVIGCYIQEYEQNGADRAKYGENLFAKLSQRVKKSASVVYHPRELRRCREFYTAYPQIWGTLSPKFDHIVPDAIRESLIPESTAVATPTIRGSVTPELNRLLLAGMDNHLFVSKYQLELPKKEEMQRFLAQQLKEVGCGK